MSENTIQISKHGAYYTARYAGRPNCCFGETPNDARRRLEASDWCAVNCNGNKQNQSAFKYMGLHPRAGTLLFYPINPGENNHVRQQAA